MKLELTLKQYNLIFRIISAVGENASYAPGVSCQFYNATGAYILKKALKIDARPVIGASFIKVDEFDIVLACGVQEGDKFYSTPEGFHCWVETPSSYIDFTSPEYNDSAKNRAIRPISPIPRKMFQKPKSSMCGDPNLLYKPGDFFFCENRALTEYLMQRFISNPLSGDLAEICLDWYKKSKKKLLREVTVMNELGETTQIKLKNSGVQSAW